MKSVSIFLTTVVIIALSIISVSSNAQNSAPLGASATIVAPSSIAKHSDLKLVNVPIRSASSHNLQYSRSAAYNLDASTSSGNIIAASFTISGYANYAYAITLPASITISSGANSITIGTNVTSASSTHTLSDHGTDAVSVAGTISSEASYSMNTSAKADNFPVTVIYN